MKQHADEWTPTGNTPTILVKGQRWRHGETLVIITDAEPLPDGRISTRLLVSADIKGLPSLGHDGWKFCGIYSTIPHVEVGHTIKIGRPIKEAGSDEL